MKIRVRITETLQRDVMVEAETVDEALDKVKEMYNNEEIILDEGDYVDTDYDIFLN